MMKHLKIALALWLTLLLPFSNLSAQNPTDSIPESYEERLRAAYETYEILSLFNDVVLHPIEVTPVDLSILSNPSNWAKTLYSLPKITPTKKVMIFVLDTENVFSHKDLLPYARNDLARTYTNEPVAESQGHGIHCAGIIVSKEEGILKEYEGFVYVVPFKVLNAQGTGDFQNIAKGIRDVPEVMKQFPDWSCIISLSLGGSGTNATINSAIDFVVKQGIYVYAASGNNGLEAISTPANAPGANAVGSIDENLRRSSFSNFGSKLYCVAPGRNIRSTWKNNSYVVLNGTSMACPNAVAAAAYDLMQGKIPLSGFQDVPPTGFDKETGNGYYKNNGSPSDPPPPPPPPAPEEPKRKTRRVNLYLEGEFPMIYSAEGETATKKLIVTEIEVSLRSDRVTESLTQIVEDQVYGFFKNRGLFLLAGSDLQEAVLWSGFFLEQDAGFKSINYDVLSIRGYLEGRKTEVVISGNEIDKRSVRVESRRIMQALFNFP